MKAVRQFGVLLVLLMWAAVPTMVCATPTAQMTASERACCEHMKGSCGDIGMPLSHGCCHKVAQANQVSALHASVATAPSSDLAAVTTLPANGPSPEFSSILTENFDASPPQPPPAAINILRI
jgi:hypothetical protein